MRRTPVQGKSPEMPQCAKGEERIWLWTLLIAREGIVLELDGRSAEYFSTLGEGTQAIYLARRVGMYSTW
jgi:hypothetical protein